MRSGKSVFPAIWRNSAIGSTDDSNWKTSFPGLFPLRPEPRPFPTGLQYWLRIMGNQENLFGSIYHVSPPLANSSKGGPAIMMHSEMVTGTRETGWSSIAWAENLSRLIP